MTTKPSGRIERDLDLLRGLAGHADLSGLGVVQLATLVGRDKSQVSRALRALEAAGLVERDVATGRYHLGLELYALAASTAQARLLRLSPPVLRALAAQLDESVHLCTLHGRDLLTLRSFPPITHAFRAGSWEGRLAPAQGTSAGRVLLGDLDADEIRRLFAGADVSAPGPGARVQTINDLIEVVSEARRRGYAVVREEFEPGVVGASAAVRDFRGEIVAAINVSAEATRLGKRLDQAGRACANAAGRLSRSLGALRLHNGMQERPA